MSRNPLFICIMGIDGMGKTTHVNLLVNYLKNKNIQSKYIWLRFHHLISLPLLGYCRLVGYTRIVTTKDGQRFYYPEFYRSKAVSLLYPYLLLIDVTIFTIIKVYIPMVLGTSIVSDRFVYDTIVDLSVATGDKDLKNKVVGKLFLKLIPKNAQFIMLYLDKNTILQRRPELIYDETFDNRYDLYGTLSSDIFVIDNSNNLNDVQKLIINRLLLDEM